MEIQVNYGTDIRSLVIENADVDILAPTNVPEIQDLGKNLRDALDAPLDSPSLEDLIQSSNPRTIGIAIPDETRPTPIHLILPELVRRIRTVSPETQITVIVGAGLHPPMPQDRLREFIPKEIWDQCTVTTHDELNMEAVHVGTTSRGTPVIINKIFADTDLKIVIGQIDPHQFVGFTGGSKGAVIGVGARASIEHNHALMFHDAAQVGRLDGNPVREDLNEAGRLIGIGFVINVVLNPEKQVVQLFAGDPESVLRAGSQICARVYGVRIKGKYDIAVASSGGYPKDICLYQAQKGLNLASHCLKPGGKILLLAECDQGIGDDVYFDYVSQFATPAEVMADFKKLGFKMGAHKAYLFGRTQTDFDVAVASDLDPQLLNQCLLRPADPNGQVREWIENFSGRPRVAVIPYANTTFFIAE